MGVTIYQRMKMMIKIAICLAVSLAYAKAKAIDTTEVADLTECYIGMDTSTYRCVPETDANFLHCKIEAPKKCKCMEGLVCKREAFTKEGVTEQQCNFQCVIKDPIAYGMKRPEEWDENMELFLK